MTYAARHDQALIYRLPGDRNPLHSDPEFARRAGLDRPILHGLCSYGLTGRALLHVLCGSDPGRFASMRGRFSRPTYPGESLNVSIWVDGPTARFRTVEPSSTGGSSSSGDVPATHRRRDMARPRAPGNEGAIRSTMPVRCRRHGGLPHVYRKREQ